MKMLRDAAIAAALLIVTLLVYYPAASYGFVDLDDGAYVEFNDHILAGLTGSSVRWAFTQGHAANWHPLTWVSLMLDREIWGQAPGGFHITNVLLHGFNAVLLFAVLRRMKGAAWASALAAAWFALHPAHVESVAWISERKDVLSTMFWLLTMLAYLGYARSPSLWRYALVALLLALGLMSKSMLVTLPAVLLLMDVWPLQRLRLKWSRENRVAAMRLIAEKLPLMMMVLGSCIVTLMVQRRFGAVADLPRSVAWPNIPVAYVRYIGKFFWPADLCAYYPFPGVLGHPARPMWIVLASAALLMVITAIVMMLVRRRPWWLFGWLWFVGTLVPVIGVVPIGNQSIADRYTYVPFIGLFLALAWEARELALRNLAWRIAVCGAALASLIACIALTARQIPHWRDTDSLFRRALAVTDRNWHVRNYYGNYLVKQQRIDEGIQQYEAAVELMPQYPLSHEGLAWALFKGGRYYEAVAEYRTAIELDPNNAQSHYRLGVALSERREYAAAIESIEKAMKLDPQNAVQYQEWLTRLNRLREGGNR